jgi:uncharacterized membrane protein (UPF0136 family)
MTAPWQKGFSLVETLVASVILFSALTSAFLAFQGALIGSLKAESRLELLKAMPQVRRSITSLVQEAKASSGKGVTDGVVYAWTAELQNTGVVLDLDAGSGDGFGAPSERLFSLWRVSVTLERGGVERQFSFTELSWVE